MTSWLLLDRKYQNVQLEEQCRIQCGRERRKIVFQSRMLFLMFFYKKQHENTNYHLRVLLLHVYSYNHLSSVHQDIFPNIYLEMCITHASRSHSVTLISWYPSEEVADATWLQQGDLSPAIVTLVCVHPSPFCWSLNFWRVHTNPLESKDVHRCHWRGGSSIRRPACQERKLSVVSKVA